MPTICKNLEQSFSKKWFKYCAGRIQSYVPCSNAHRPTTTINITTEINLCSQECCGCSHEKALQSYKAQDHLEFKVKVEHLLMLTVLKFAEQSYCFFSS